eukprot:SAG11_NODE_38893_length_246_cov_92.863946_2_plen_52_part_01
MMPDTMREVLEGQPFFLRAKTAFETLTGSRGEQRRPDERRGDETRREARTGE